MRTGPLFGEVCVVGSGGHPAETRAESPVPAQALPLSLGGVSPWDPVGAGH